METFAPRQQAGCTLAPRIRFDGPSRPWPQDAPVGVEDLQQLCPCLHRGGGLQRPKTRECGDVSEDMRVLCYVLVYKINVYDSTAREGSGATELSREGDGPPVGTFAWRMRYSAVMCVSTCGQTSLDQKLTHQFRNKLAISRRSEIEYHRIMFLLGVKKRGILLIGNRKPSTKAGPSAHLEIPSFDHNGHRNGGHTRRMSSLSVGRLPGVAGEFVVGRDSRRDPCLHTCWDHSDAVLSQRLWQQPSLHPFKNPFQLRTPLTRPQTTTARSREVGGRQRATPGAGVEPLAAFGEQAGGPPLRHVHEHRPRGPCEPWRDGTWEPWKRTAPDLGHPNGTFGLQSLPLIERIKI